MKSTKKKTPALFCVILSLLMLSAYACADKGGNNSTGSTDKPGSSGVTSGTQTDDPIAALDPGLEDQNFNGREIIFLTRDRGTGYNEFGITEDSPNNVESAVYWRNFRINEKFGCRIGTIMKAQNEVIKYAQTQIGSGELDFDTITEGFVYQVSLAANDFLLDISSIPVIDITKEYWHQSLQNDTSVAGHNFYLVSYANMWSMNAASVVFFNTELVKELKLEKSPYELVASNEWTFETMDRMNRQAYSDLDADGKASVADRFGSVSTYAACETMFVGMGGRLTTKNKDTDIPELSLFSDKTYDIYTKIIDFWSEDGSLLINRYSDYVSQRKNGNLLSDTMVDGRALFCQEHLYQLDGFTDSQYVIGMVPVPKYDENQENYRTYVHKYHGSSTSVPKTISEENLGQIGYVLEEMAYLSYVDVRPAFYDVNLKNRKSQDEESKKMLDIIFENISFDIGCTVSGLDSAPDILRDLTFSGASDKVVSSLAGKQESYQTALNDIIAKYQGMKS